MFTLFSPRPIRMGAMGYYLDQQNFENGNVTIYRRNDGGPNYHCRVKVTAEKRYVTRTCKTTDPEQARQFAIALYYQSQALNRPL